MRDTAAFNGTYPAFVLEGILDERFGLLATTEDRREANRRPFLSISTLSRFRMPSSMSHSVELLFRFPGLAEFEGWGVHRA